MKSRDWKALMFLSIALPVGLLVTFRFTGLTKQPTETISEITTLDTIHWSGERPTDMTNIKESITGFCEDETSLIHQIFVSFYTPEDPGGRPALWLWVNESASVKLGFVSSLNFTFWEDYNGSGIQFIEFHSWLKGDTLYSHAENLSIIDHAHGVYDSGPKGFVALAGTNQPESVHFDGWLSWLLCSPTNRTHLMKVNMETVYFNGTVFKKVIQPFELRIGPDDNNSFEAADPLGNGSHKALWLGGYDTVDYYCVHAEKGDTIYVNAQTGSIVQYGDGVYLGIEVYDPSREWKANSSLVNGSWSVLSTADSSGEWFICTHLATDFFGYDGPNYGLYVLTVDVQH